MSSRISSVNNVKTSRSVEFYIISVHTLELWHEYIKIHNSDCHFCSLNTYFQIL